MPRILKWAGILSALGLVASAFLPWVTIESRGLQFTGLDTTGSNFGKPALVHFVFTAFFLFFTLVPRLWAKRANLPVVGLNLGWAVRNFILIAACQGGECPVKKAGLILSLICSLIMFASALFPDMKLRSGKMA